MKLLDTFAGIGGFSYAAEKLVGGFETTQFIEINPYCQKVLNKHWSHVPIHDDIKTFSAYPGQYDVITGGFPCQDISVAGRKEGITKKSRSGLFYELIRVIRLVRPKYVVLENVAAILNNGLDIVLGELAEAGFDCEWACISASSLGACHRRSRWWCVAINREFAYTDSIGCGGGSSERRTVQERTILSGKQTGSEMGSETQRCSINTSNTKSRAWDEYEVEQKHGEVETQEISRDRNSSGDTREFTDSYSKGMERRKLTIDQKLQKTGFTWKSNTPHLSPEWRKYVSKSVLCRGDDGLRNRVDRLRSLGNSVVVQCAAIPLQRVKDL